MSNMRFQYHSGNWSLVNTENLIAETPVSLTVNGEIWLIFSCSPYDLDALGVGFLYNEGVIESADQIASVRVCADLTNIDVWLNQAAEKPEKWLRTSGCTGGIANAEPARHVRPLARFERFDPQRLLENMDQLYQVEGVYQQTRGLHCSALSDGVAIQLYAVDIGRHNTLDKLAGLMLFSSVQLERRVVLTTGRISSEMVQKSVRMGAQVVMSRTSPTTLAVQMAETLNVTLIGYARHQRFVVYSHPQRVAGFAVVRETLTDQEFEPLE